jgi:hypothetical protein
VADINVAIHHPRKVLLVGPFGCLRSKLISRATTGLHYTRGRPARDQTTNSSIWSPFTRDGILGKLAGSVLSR